MSISPPRSERRVSGSWPDRADRARTQAWELLQQAAVEAVRGDQMSCRSHVAQSGGLAPASQLPVLDAFADHVLGLLELSLGNFNVAVWHLNRSAARLRVLPVDDPALVRFEPDLVESLIALGDQHRGARVTVELSLRAERFDSDWARVAACRCRGLLAGAEAFEREFARSLDFQNGVSAFDRARTQLLFGERLRRSRRRIDARELLTAALNTFEQLGARPWIVRSVRELEATTVTARPRHDPSITDELTPQERTVVALMVQGATVREAALRLFLSPKTVEAHLGRAYRKLGVRNRAQLAMMVSRA